MDVNAVVAEHTARVTALDPLLPVPPPLAPGAGALLTTDGGAAIAWFSEAAPGTAARTWEPARRHNLEVRLAGPDPAAALGRLLDQWADRLGSVPPGDTDRAALVELPSRDTAAVPALVHRGFVPVSAVAARRAGRVVPAARGDVVVRRATVDDLDVAVELNLEVVHYDAVFGKVTPREDTAEALRGQLAFLLGAREPTVWLGEVGGEVVGLVHLQLPPMSSWARSYTNREVAYLACLGVRAGSRGTGVGTALAAHAHGVVDRADLPLTVLHHALPNPRSTPFWYSHGYRPLWTLWMRKPIRR